MSHLSLSFVRISFFLVPPQTSTTIFTCPLLVLYENLAAISPCIKPSYGFCVIMVSSRFSALISCGTLYITTLGFLSFGSVTSTSFPQLSLIEELSEFASSGVPVSMRTLPSFRDLKDLTPTLIAVGFTFVFRTVLIASVERLDFGFTSILYCLSELALTAWE